MVILIAVTISATLAVAMWIQSVIWGETEREWDFDTNGDGEPEYVYVPSGDLHIVSVRHWTMMSERGWYLEFENLGEGDYFIIEITVSDYHGSYPDGVTTTVWNGSQIVSPGYLGRSMQIEYNWYYPNEVPGNPPFTYHIRVYYTNSTFETLYSVRYIVDTHEYT